MFNIVQKRRWYFTISGILVALSIGLLIASTVKYGEPLRRGIDFVGGSRFVLSFTEPVDEESLRAAFAAQGIENPVLQQRSDSGGTTWQVRTPSVTADEVTSELDDETSAYKAGLRKMRSLTSADYDEFRLRLFSYLRRRGFSYEVAGRVVERLWFDRQASAT